MVAIIPEITPDPEVETIPDPALALALEPATTLALAIMLDRVIIRLRLYI